MPLLSPALEGMWLQMTGALSKLKNTEKRDFSYFKTLRFYIYTANTYWNFNIY